MVTSCIPFNFVEKSYIKKALGVFGVSPLTRRQISGRMLDDLEADIQAAMATDVASLDYPAGSSDGWRKKFCQDGAGLMNFCVLGESCKPLSDQAYPIEKGIEC